VLAWAVGAVGAEAESVVGAHVSLDVAHRTVHGLEFTESVVEIGAVLVFAVTCRCLVPVDALLALEAVAFLLEVSADRHPVFLVNVQILTLFAPLALLLEPVDAHDFLVL